MRSLVIRVDCNPKIASGHLMRCLSIAKAAKQDGFDVTFFMADDASKDLVLSKGFNFICLNSIWDSLKQEIPLMISYSNRYRNAILLIDTYSVTAEYTNSLAPYYRIVYLGSKRIVLPGIRCLINYSTCIDRNFYQTSYPGINLLLGPLYTPLRDEFLGSESNASNEVRDVLVTTGNTDPDSFSYKLLSRILCGGFESVNFNVVVGRMFHDKDCLSDLAEKYDNIILHENVRSMSDLFRKCQIAISANGTTVYELCASKVPVISFAMVNEQEESGRSMCSLGMVEYCGLFVTNEKACIDTIVNRLSKYVSSVELRESLISRASSLVDGNGCRRIIDEFNKINNNIK